MKINVYSTNQGGVLFTLPGSKVDTYWTVAVNSETEGASFHGQTTFDSLKESISPKKSKKK